MQHQDSSMGTTIDRNFTTDLRCSDQTLKTRWRWAMGLLLSSPQTTQNSVLPLVKRARKSSASIKMPVSTARFTISSGVLAAKNSSCISGSPSTKRQRWSTASSRGSEVVSIPVGQTQFNATQAPHSAAHNFTDRALDAIIIGLKPTEVQSNAQDKQQRH